MELSPCSSFNTFLACMCGTCSRCSVRINAYDAGTDCRRKAAQAPAEFSSALAHAENLIRQSVRRAISRRAWKAVLFLHTKIGPYQSCTLHVKNTACIPRLMDVSGPLGLRDFNSKTASPWFFSLARLWTYILPKLPAWNNFKSILL